MLQRMRVYIQKRLGFTFLVLLLLWMTFVSIRPHLYLIGWDNYSSYLGGADSFFRTIFSTWREYRGIGVPGDSESVDIVRQVFVWMLAPFSPEPVRDQLYMLFCLWVGVLSVYALMTKLIRRYIHVSEQLIDIAAVAAGAMYLLNLNTLATFYFPIITYITRFASLPLLLIAFDYFIHHQKLTKSILIGFLVAVGFSVGSMLTATVFFTTLILLGSYCVFQGNWRRSIVALLLFVGMNTFWFVPFTNYTVQKSSALRLAPVFIDTNEAQLNQSPESYSLWKQFIMYPNFFHTRYTEIDTGTKVPFHPMTDLVDSQSGNMALALFPIGAFIGIVLIFSKRRKFAQLYWIPIIYTAFAILSSQEFSSLGFIPALLNKIPYFQVVFRFGDTKFHPYIAFSGSMLFGFGVIWIGLLLHRWRKLAVVVPTVITLASVILLLSTVYRTYFTGDFFPKYLFVSLPPAYREIANVVNADPSDGRLLHLPYDPDLYWRSHSWGYMGSAFFQYLLTKPYFDKTFEPASLEMTDWYRELTDVIQDANQIIGDGLQGRAQRFMKLMDTSHITWILYDDSVTPELRIRNMRYWGSFNTTDSLVLLKYLEKTGSIEMVKESPISLPEIASVYQQLLGQKPQLPLGSPQLTLYRIKHPSQTIYFPTQLVSVNAGLTRAASFPDATVTVRQSSGRADTLIYPFAYKNMEISQKKDGMQLQLSIANPETSDTVANITIGEGYGRVVEASVQREKTDMIIRLYRLYGPNIGSVKMREIVQTIRMPLRLVPDASDVLEQSQDYLANWHVLETTNYGPIRLAIEDVVLPVPPLTDETEHLLGAVLVTNEKPTLSVLHQRKNTLVDTGKFILTDEPNCFGDQLSNYSYSFASGEDAVLTSRNGSTCMVYPFTDTHADHVEIRLQYHAESRDDVTDVPVTKSSKPRVTSYVTTLPKPNMLSLCLEGSEAQGCNNTHQMIQLQTEGAMVIPTEFINTNLNAFRLALIPVGKQEQSITITGGLLYEFEKVKEYPLLMPHGIYTRSIPLGSDGVSITMPYILSRGSYYSGGDDGWFVSNRPCEQSGGYRTTRVVPQGLLSYLEGCYNEFSMPIPFDSRLPKLWFTSYAVYAGKYPKFSLGDPFGHYSNQYLSLYQGYPNVAGMLALQAPQQWYRPYTDTHITDVLHFIAKRAYIWVRSSPELTDTREKSYTIHQDSQNEGIVGVFGQNIMEFPSAWEHMRIQVGESDRTYADVTKSSMYSILPSLTKVKLQHASESLYTRLLVQRAGYDTQWQAYPDIHSMIFGIGGITADRCDGLYNCYELPPTSDTWYLFYTPERLAIIGWLVTIGIVAIFLLNRRAISRL